MRIFFSLMMQCYTYGIRIDDIVMTQDKHTEKKFVVRSRAVIMHNGELLLVKHPHNTRFAALPGGHLEWGEDPRECLRREIIEELGIEPVLGRLLYINTFMDGEYKQPFEFFIEVTNGKDFKNAVQLSGVDAHEIAEILWVTPDTEERILPLAFADDFKEGKLMRDEARFING